MKFLNTFIVKYIKLTLFNLYKHIEKYFYKALDIKLSAAISKPMLA